MEDKSKKHAQEPSGYRKPEETLSESEARYRSLFDHMLNGLAYCKMIFENDKPQDFVYLAVNGAFETLTGLKNVVGRKVTEVIPGIRESDPGLFEIYGRVARTGVPETFETYVKSLENWFSISVYSPEKDHFVAIFDVITERKKTEEDLKKELANRAALLDNLPCIALILHKGDRRIVAFNKMASNFGDLGGKTCYQAIAKRTAPCPFCRAPEMWATNEPKRIEVEYEGSYYEGVWVPLSEETYVHYVFNITNRKKVEAEVVKHIQELEIFHRTSMGREKRIIELKQEVDEALKAANKPPRYGV